MVTLMWLDREDATWYWHLFPPYHYTDLLAGAHHLRAAAALVQEEGGVRDSLNGRRESGQMAINEDDVLTWDGDDRVIILRREQGDVDVSCDITQGRTPTAAHLSAAAAILEELGRHHLRVTFAKLDAQHAREAREADSGAVRVPPG